MRLIDADEFKKYISNMPLTNASKEMFKSAIKAQPTAYDIDKVVEELKKLQTEAFSYDFKYDDDFYNGQANGLDKAIEIVKQGVR